MFKVTLCEDDVADSRYGKKGRFLGLEDVEEFIVATKADYLVTNVKIRMRILTLARACGELGKHTKKLGKEHLLYGEIPIFSDLYMKEKEDDEIKYTKILAYVLTEGEAKLVGEMKYVVTKEK